MSNGFNPDDTVEPSTLDNEANVEIEFWNKGGRDLYRVLVGGKRLVTSNMVLEAGPNHQPMRITLDMISMGEMKVQRIKGTLTIESREDVEVSNDD